MQRTVMTKVAALASGLAMATTMLSFAPMAHAACSVGMTDLTVGSTGDAVKCLQETLIAGGHLTMPAGVMTGYFGGLTKAAVAKWQASVGISPAVGYFGPISRAKFVGAPMGGSFPAGCTSATGYSTTTGQSCASGGSGFPAGCTSAVGFSPTTGQSCSGAPATSGPLAGTDGTISDVDKLGSYENEEVAEGNNDVKVLGADIEASSDGDIALKAIKVSFDSTGNTGSDNLDDYIESVSVWLGSTKIGSADVDEFSENATIFSKTITLSGNTTIKADEIAKLYIAVDAAGTIDSGDISGDSWNVGIDSIRFVDGSGVFTTDSTTGDLGATTLTIVTAGTDGVDMDFVTFATSANSELKITLASDSPEAGIVVIDDSSNTNDVSLLKGKLKLDGTADAVLDELPVTFTTVGGANLAAVTGSVKLKIGSETFTESVSSSATAATITFDNLDFAIDAGQTVNFEVLADINDIDAGNLDQGDTLKAEVTATNRNYIDIENSEGDQLSDSSEKSGTALGDALIFRTSGIALALVGTPTAVNDGDDAAQTGTFKIRYKVTAIGDTVYVSSLTTSVSMDYAVQRSGTETTATTISGALVNETDTDLTSVGNYQIDEDQSETFELTVVVPNGTGGTTGLYRLVLQSLDWSLTDVANPATTYNSNMDAFVTPYVNLNKS